MGEVLIRHATERDAEAIRAIYNHEVENETSTFDLVPRSLQDQLEWQNARQGAFCVYVAELDGEVVGFGALSPYKERAAYRTSVEDSVYVRRDMGQKGIGQALLGHLLTTAADNLVIWVVGLARKNGLRHGGSGTRDWSQIQQMARRCHHAVPAARTPRRLGQKK